MFLIDRLVNGLFMSVTPPTAGFNTINYAEAANNTNFLTILLMFVGRVGPLSFAVALVRRHAAMQAPLRFAYEDVAFG